MTFPKPSFYVDVDVTNPGQFFACCGLLEVAHRLWPGAESWFDPTNHCFAVAVDGANGNLKRLVGTLRQCDVSGLTESEHREREALEEEKRDLKKQQQTFPPNKEKRRKELGERARGGALHLGDPVALLLDWWQTGDDEAMPKTWAGRQEIHRIARAAQNALSDINSPTTLFDYGCVLRMPEEYCKRKSDSKKSVEPFYFDARRFSHALDAGFSLDKVEAETIAHPAVELLGLIGLQRFRPSPASVKWHFDYWVWSRPLRAPIAASVVNGAVSTPDGEGYRFPLRFRDDQKRYKAFGWAMMTGGNT